MSASQRLLALARATRKLRANTSYIQQHGQASTYIRYLNTHTTKHEVDDIVTLTTPLPATVEHRRHQQSSLLSASRYDNNSDLLTIQTSILNFESTGNYAAADSTFHLYHQQLPPEQWNQRLKSLISRQDLRSAMQLYAVMLKMCKQDKSVVERGLDRQLSGVAPDQNTYATLLCGYATLPAAEYRRSIDDQNALLNQIHMLLSDAKQLSITHVAATYANLLLIYGKCCRIDRIWQTYEAAQRHHACPVSVVESVLSAFELSGAEKAQYPAIYDKLLKSKACKANATRRYGLLLRYLSLCISQQLNAQPQAVYDVVVETVTQYSPAQQLRLFESLLLTSLRLHEYDLTSSVIQQMDNLSLKPTSKYTQHLIDQFVNGQLQQQQQSSLTTADQHMQPTASSPAAYALLSHLYSIIATLKQEKQQHGSAATPISVALQRKSAAYRRAELRLKQARALQRTGQLTPTTFHFNIMMNVAAGLQLHVEVERIAVTMQRYHVPLDVASFTHLITAAQARSLEPDVVVKYIAQYKLAHQSTNATQHNHSTQQQQTADAAPTPPASSADDFPPSSLLWASALSAIGIANKEVKQLRHLVKNAIRYFKIKPELFDGAKSLHVHVDALPARMLLLHTFHMFRDAVEYFESLSLRQINANTMTVTSMLAAVKPTSLMHRLLTQPLPALESTSNSPSSSRTTPPRRPHSSLTVASKKSGMKLTA